MKLNFKERMKQEKGITLIALVITIIVLLILAGVAIVTLTGENGILTQAQNAKEQTEVAKEIEQIRLAVTACRTNAEYSDITLEGLKKELESYKEISKVEGINSVPTNAKQVAKVNQKLNLANMFIPVSYADTEKFEYAKVTYTSGRSYVVKLRADNVGTIYELSEIKPFDATEWDKSAAGEDCFYWESDDPNSEGYGTVVGYTNKIENYSLLKFPSRCKKIDLTKSASITWDDGISRSFWYGYESRAYTNNIIKVEMPETVRSIGHEAFGTSVRDSFKGLKEIVIEGGLESIAGWAFNNCSSLKNVTIRGDVGEIGEYVFYGTGLTNLVIEGRVESIGVHAFSDLKDLTNVTIGGSSGDINAKTIGANAFEGCKNLVNLNIKCDEIGSYAFQNCDSLERVSVSSDVIGEGAFCFDGKLSGVILNEGLKTIGSRAFSFCPIEEIKIPESVTSIGNYAFSSLVGSIIEINPYLETFYIKYGSELVITPSTWGVPEDTIKYY